MSTYVDGIVTEGLHSTHKQKQLITGVLKYIQSKKHIFRVLLSNHGDLDLQRDILSFFGERIFGSVQETEKKAYQYIYASTGSFGMIYHWIMDDEPADIEKLAEWITAFNSSVKE